MHIVRRALSSCRNLRHPARLRRLLFAAREISIHRPGVTVEEKNRPPHSLAAISASALHFSETATVTACGHLLPNSFMACLISSGRPLVEITARSTSKAGGALFRSSRQWYCRSVPPPSPRIDRQGSFLPAEAAEMNTAVSPSLPDFSPGGVKLPGLTILYLKSQPFPRNAGKRYLVIIKAIMVPNHSECSVFV